MPQNRTAHDEAGNIWEVDAQGNAVRLVQAAPQQQMPADPTYPYQGRRAEAETRNVGATAAVNEATQAAQIRQQQADAARAEADARRAAAEADEAERGSERALSPAQLQVDQEFAAMYAEMQASGGIADVRKQVDQLRDAIEVLRTSDDITGPVIGRMPEWVQQSINPDAINVREQVEEVVQRNLRLILGAQFTQEEGRRLIERAYNPRQQEEENIDRIDRLVGQMEGALASRESAINYYEQNGTIAGWTAPEDTGPNAMNTVTVQTGDAPRQAAGAGATTTVVDAYPDPEGHAQLVMRLMAENNGRLDPQAYARERAALDRANNLQPSPAGELAAWANGVNEYFDGGGTTIPTMVMPEERELSGTERFRNNLVNSPLGAAATATGDAGGFGLVSALAPEQMGALREERPGAMLAGDIAGSIGGTALLGGATRFAVNQAGRGGQRLGNLGRQVLADSGRARFGRNVATDAGYAGIYGANTGQDPLESAMWGAGGSVVGQGLGRAAGATARGVAESQPVQYLRQRGVPLTTGQTIGGMLGRVEERAMSIPVVGDMIRNRRIDSMEGFNRAAFDEGLDPIGRHTANVGEQGIDEARNAVGQAYTDALSGVTLTPDQAFTQSIDGAVQSGSRGKFSDDFLQIMNDDIAPIMGPQGQLGGRAVQDMLQVTGDNARYYDDLATSGTGATPRQPQARPVAQAFRDMNTAVEGLAGRQAPEVMPALQGAGQAYRNAEILRRSVHAGRGGTQSGTPGQFTPFQLSTAAGQNANRFGNTLGTTQQPFFELSRAGQQVLPQTIPNSGTADRLIQGGVGTALLGGGAGLGYAAGGGEGAQTGAAATTLAALLAAMGGTRQGQRFINSALTRRPETMRRLGDWTLRNSGLFGTAAMAPVVVGQN